MRPDWPTTKERTMRHPLSLIEPHWASLSRHPMRRTCHSGAADGVCNPCCCCKLHKILSLICRSGLALNPKTGTSSQSGSFGNFFFSLPKNCCPTTFWLTQKTNFPFSFTLQVLLLPNAAHRLVFRLLRAWSHVSHFVFFLVQMIVWSSAISKLMQIFTVQFSDCG